MPLEGRPPQHHFFGGRAKKIVTPCRRSAVAPGRDPLTRSITPARRHRLSLETMMFTKTFTIERHIEELRAELRATTDSEEARDIRAELEVALMVAADPHREGEAAI